MSVESSTSQKGTARQVIRQLFIGTFHGIELLDAERWYFTYHAPENLRQKGPWLRRYETYLTLTPQADAPDGLNLKSGYMSELWWDSVEAFQESGGEPTGWVKLAPNGRGRPWTPAPFKDRSPSGQVAEAMTIIPAVPTTDHLGTEPGMDAPVLRWIRAFRYGPSLSRSEGDEWYEREVVPHVVAQSDVLRYISFKTIDYPPATESGPYGPWDRVDEIWYPTWDALIAGNTAYPTPVSGENDGTFMVSNVVRMRPTVDFLRDEIRVP